MKIALRFVLTYLILITVFSSAIILVHFIPSHFLTENAEDSIITMKKEGVYPKLLHFKLYQLDNYTDAVMLNLAVSEDSDQPVQSAMLNYWYNTNINRAILIDTQSVIEHDTEGLIKMSYGRYWQGYLVVLRPVLTLFDYSQIRILNYLLLSGLIIFIAYAMKKKIDTTTMALFLASLLIINFPIVPLSMQFSNVFYLTFLAIIAVLYKHETLEKNQLMPFFFFIIGGCTSFFDFLTTPLVTLGLPITIYILLQKDRIYRSIVISSVCWAAGYGSIWASKWYIGQLFTGQDILDIAMNSASLHTSNEWRGMEMTLPNISSFIYTTLTEDHLLLPIFGGLILYFVLYFFYLRSREAFINNLHFLLIAAMAPVWFLVLRHHSIQHGWFTWRALVVSIFAGLIFIFKTLDFQKKSIFSRQKKQIAHE